MIKSVLYAGQWVLSVIFIVQMYLAMAVIGIVFFPWALASRRGARAACKSWCRYVCWSARWIVGLRCEVRGTPPTGQVLIASKHQSFLDIIMIYASVPAAKFIMKRELLWTPVLGQYATRVGCVPVDRGKRGAAIMKMLRDVEKGKSEPGQLVIYPQGTRVAPGVRRPFKVGAALIYEQTGHVCAPAAVNVGVFWPRRGIYRKRGTAVLEWLPQMPAGMPKTEFLAELERVVETASIRLEREAGFHAPD